MPIALSVGYRFALAAVVLFILLARKRQLVPIVALNVSAIFEGYQWTAAALTGLVLVMLGNVLVFKRQPVVVPAVLRA